MKILWFLIAIVASNPILTLDPTASFGPIESSLNSIVYFENTTNILMQETKANQVWLSTDEGKSWSKTPISTTPGAVILHPFAKATTAFYVTKGTDHYSTTDAGQTWTKFTSTLRAASLLPETLSDSLSFHPADPSRWLFQGHNCTIVGKRSTCHSITFLVSSLVFTPLLDWTEKCVWVSNVNPSSFDLLERVLCTRWPPDMQQGDSQYKNFLDLELVALNTSSLNPTKIPFLGGVPLIASIDHWLLLIVEKSDERNLYTSKDGLHFNVAVFPDTVPTAQIGYTILESTNASLVVDVLGFSRTRYPRPFGDLYISNSQGTSFVKSLAHTNRVVARGLVDFERLQMSLFEGILIANTVTNWKEVMDQIGGTKRLTSVLSFDNGGSWSRLIPPPKDVQGSDWGCNPTDESCSLHLHSVSTSRNIGKVFSATAAPGFVIGIGSVGSFLADYDASDTFMSPDAGKSWVNIAKGPRKFEFLDMGSTLVLVPEGPSSEIQYSVDRGSTFKTMPILLPNSPTAKWTASYTITDPNASSQKMLMLLTTSTSNQKAYFTVHMDFSNILSRKCDLNVNNPSSSPDFEAWYPATPENGCILGRKVGYYRRTATADCLVKSTMDLPQTTSQSCPCSDMDLECDRNYIRNTSMAGMVCVEESRPNDQPADCKIGQTYPGVSGYRLIPGDLCQGSLDKLIPVQKACQKPGRGETKPPLNAVLPISSSTSLPQRVDQIILVNNTGISLVLSHDGIVWVSYDSGKSWHQHPEIQAINAPIVRIGPHDTVPSRIFFFTPNDIYVTNNGLGGIDGKLGVANITQLNLPHRYNSLGIRVIDFHPTEPDWYVFVLGARGCPNADQCFTHVYATKDAGKTFFPVDTWANKCLWAWDANFQDPAIDKDAIYCLSYQFKDQHVGQDKLIKLSGPKASQNPAQFVMISNSGKERVTLIAEHTSDFYVVSGILVAATGASYTPNLVASVDGQRFTTGQFPPYTSIEKNSYTVLESNTGGIFLDILESVDPGQEYGNLFKSNSNGQFFSLALSDSNRGSNGKVDFERLHGIPGIILANRVENVDRLGIAQKEIATKISYNDGSTWSRLIPPIFDSENGRISCPNPSKCSLHLHFESDEETGNMMHHSLYAAPGFMMGVGNVGDQLLDYNLGNVFVTRDGGQSWIEVVKDAHKWAIGDYGGLIVLVNDEKPVDSLIYSWDFGYTWASYQFSAEPIRIERVEAQPTPDARQFIITGHLIKGDSTIEISTTIVNVDFSTFFARKCVSTGSSDFETWQPTKGTCFFGEKTTFTRRKEDAVCYIGSDFGSFVKGDGVCQCSEQDFECDYNFFRDETGGCSLYGDDPDAALCANGQATTYLGSSGFRKIALSKCSGGMDPTAKVTKPCPQQGSHPGEIAIATYSFNGKVTDFLHFESSSSILVLDDQGRLYVSGNEGVQWYVFDQLDQVKKIITDPYVPSRAFIVTNAKLWIYSTQNQVAPFLTRLISVNLPTAHQVPTSIVSISLHPYHADWLLWVASVCDSSAPCQSSAYVSWNLGSTWDFVALDVQECKWGTTNKFASPIDTTVFCSLSKGTYPLMKSIHPDQGINGFENLFGVSGFAIVDRYFIAASKVGNSNQLEAKISLDGSNWASAQLAQGNAVLTSNDYTVLESTGSLFLDVIHDAVPGFEHGTIMQSNWNGTYFSTMLENVNQNSRGYADFEKVENFPGILIANQITNMEDAGKGSKKVVTLMSRDNGKSWSRIPAPLVDSNRQSYDCKDCYLNLHAFTERHDKRDQYSSSDAIGMLVGVGNVGPFLTDFNLGDSFLSLDAGLSWIEMTKEAHMIEMGDHGSIIVMANDEVPIDSIKYSLDMGLSFQTLDLSETLNGTKFRVTNILTEPKGSISHFVIIGSQVSSFGWDLDLTDGFSRDVTTHSIAVHVDFNSYWPRICSLNDDPEKSDFEPWTLMNKDECVMGSKKVYYRRKRDRKCTVGKCHKDLPVKVEACGCTRDDFECDENHSLVSGNCVLVPGFSAPVPTCQNGQKRYTNGYRKLFLSGCQGGSQLDVPARVESCSSGLSGGAIFGILLLVLFGILGLLGLLGWWNSPHLFVGSSLRLPDDDAGLRLGGSRALASILSRGKQVLSIGGLAIKEGSLVVMQTTLSIVDWVKSKINSSSGYTPVRTTVASRFSTDAQHLELDWEDH